MRNIAQIDRSINRINRLLIQRGPVLDVTSAASWQNAIDACPDLEAKRKAYYSERYDVTRAERAAAYAAEQKAIREQRKLARRAAKEHAA